MRLMKIDLSPDLGPGKKKKKNPKGPSSGALARVQSNSLSRKIIGSQSIDVA